MVDQSDEVCSKLMEIVKNHSAQIHYYKIFVKGLPHARNYGLRRAIGEVIIFCDDDVIPGHNFIENHLQNYQEKDVGGVGGRIIPDWNQSHDNSMYRNFNTTLYPPVNGENLATPPAYLGTKGVRHIVAEGLIQTVDTKQLEKFGGGMHTLSTTLTQLRRRILTMHRVAICHSGKKPS